MERTVSILASLVVLASCGGSPSQPVVNAPGLEGLGTLTLGMTSSEAEEALRENASTFNQRDKTKDKEYYFTYMRAEAKDVKDYKEKEGSYYLSEDVLDGELQLTLGFYKDSLVVIRVRGRWGSEGAGTVRDAFKTKYGDGALSGSERGYGLYETWRSEEAEAVYFLQDDNNSNPRERKILEYVEILPAGRDIKKELSAYDNTIATEKENRRKESYGNL